MLIIDEEGIRGEVENDAVDEVEDVRESEEGDGEVNGRWVDGMAIYLSVRDLLI